MPPVPASGGICVQNADSVDTRIPEGRVRQPIISRIHFSRGGPAMANKPPNDALLNQAAELRAGGATWESVAAKLNRRADTVRKWPRDYADRWELALREAERRLV